MRARPGWFVLLLSTLGCTFEARVADATAIACSAGDPTCPSGYVCRAAVGRCFRAADLGTSAPRLERLSLNATRFARGARIDATFTVSQALASPPTVRLEQAGHRADLTVTESGDLTYVASTQVDADAREGAAQLLLSLVDTLGNEAAGLQGPTVFFDFTPPRLVPDTVRVETVPATGALRRDVSALGQGAEATVSFAFDEVLAAPPVLEPGPGLSCTRAFASPTSASFRCTAGATAAQGLHVLRATARDDVGNAAQVELPAQLTVDTVAPQAPATASDGGVVFTRQPWGTTDAGAGFWVTGAPGAAEPGALLIALDAQGSELGRSTAGADGAFRLTLSQADRVHVALRAVDGAGNASPVAPVLDVEWIASLRGKRAGRTAENPHRLEARTSFRRSLEQPDSLELDAPPTALIETAPRWLRSTGPNALANHGSVWAADRERLVVFGGDTATGPSNRLWEWDGVGWEERTPAVGGPTGRAWLGMAYDARRAKVVVFGGRTARGTTAETWEWDGAAWALRATSGPSPRLAHGMAYDTRRGKTLLYGGTTPAAEHDVDLWEWDGQQWTEVPRTSPWPPALDGTTVAYDATRGRLVLFGVTTSPLAFHTWEWDGAQWTNRSGATAPSVTFGQSMAFDAARGLTWLYGGYDQNESRRSTLWAWDGTQWTNRSPPGAEPPPRSDATLAVDPRRGELVVIGGHVTSLTPNDEVWATDGGSWSNRGAAERGPQGLELYGVTYDSNRDRLVAYGRRPAGGTPELWERSTAGWELRSLVTPFPNCGHDLAFDAVRNRAVLICGQGPTTSPGPRVWEWDGALWTDATPDGGGPGRRIDTRLAFDRARGKTVLFGGIGSGGLLRDVWDWDGVRWTDRTPPDGGPSPRYAHALVYDSQQQRVLVVGGTTRAYMADSADSALWAWDGARWTDLTIDGGMPGVTNHAAVYDEARGRVVVLGGFSLGNPSNEAWEWDGARWLARTDANGPSARWNPRGTYDPVRHRAWFLGGSDPLGGIAPDHWSHAVEPGRPAVVLHVLLAHAQLEAGTRLTSILASFLAGGAGATPGAQLWRHEASASFFEGPTVSAAPPQAGPLQWLITDPAQLAATAPSLTSELGFAVTSQAQAGTGRGASVHATDAQVTVRYRRPAP